ncbi:pilus assembly protein [Hahella sp. CCB-MM4]|uniref:pirin family protein n=1 Tax=Hahella sp. (strain CCB-MM4) TaxID=1926491 RepID=UPI000B9BDD93|nr:pirin family protein [Hahella sp. CCB-MM4]OZG72318.1 pilus assembly protein [Hahella sp. CCB-MM4]
MKILHRDSLPKGGFQGVREHQLVKGSKAFGVHQGPHAWDGIGNFVYLADARFVPFGETSMHGHREVDVISVMVEGKLSHEGSLQNGQALEAGDIQVQRAGSEGFTHNEINPEANENRMIQLWVLPDKSGGRAGYKTYRPEDSTVTTIYGGDSPQVNTFDSKTHIDIARLGEKEELAIEHEAMIYVTGGSLTINGKEVNDGDLIRGNELNISAQSDSQLIVIYEAN